MEQRVATGLAAQADHVTFHERSPITIEIGQRTMRGRPEGFSLATASPVQPLAVERVAATQSPGAGQWSSHPCAFTAPPAGGADIQSIEFHDDREIGRAHV